MKTWFLKIAKKKLSPDLGLEGEKQLKINKISHNFNKIHGHSSYQKHICLLRVEFKDTKSLPKRLTRVFIDDLPAG